jgi:hypothetical protein
MRIIVNVDSTNLISQGIRPRVMKKITHPDAFKSMPEEIIQDHMRYTKKCVTEFYLKNHPELGGYFATYELVEISL